MNYFFLTVSLFLVITHLSAKEIAIGADGWIHITKKNGIDVFSKNSKNSIIRSLRAEGTVKAEIKNIVSILRAVKTATDWVPNLEKREYIENISDTEVILHDITEMPWPVKGRDLVVHHKLSLAPGKESLILHFKSVSHEKYPESETHVRAKIHRGSLEFFPRGEETFVRLTLLVDPMGKVPKWVVNFLQVKIPYEFIKALDSFASKTDLEPLPGIQKLLNQIKANPFP